MIINFGEFKSAVDMAVKVSDTEPVGILLVHDEDKSAVVFANTKQGIYKEVECQLSDEEKAIGNIIFDYKMLAEVLNKISTSGNIKIGLRADGELKHGYVCVDLSNIDNKIAKFIGDKYYTTYLGEDVYNKISSHVEIDTRAFKIADSDNKYRALDRFNYNDYIFTTNEPDEWEKSDFVNILKKLSNGDDAKLLYIIKDNKIAFTVTRTSVYEVRTPDYVENASISMLCKTAKNVADIISSLAVDKINVAVSAGGSGCSITTEDKSFGLWYEMAQGRAIDKKTFVAYVRTPDGLEELKYDDANILINKEALLDSIKSYRMNFKKPSTNITINFNSNEASTTLFKIETDEAGNETEEAVTNYSGVNASFGIGDKKNEMSEYFVVDARRKDGTPDKLPLFLIFDTWESALNLSDESNVRVDIHKVDEKNMYIRLCELSSTEAGEDGRPMVMSEAYFIVTNSVEG